MESSKPGISVNEQGIGGFGFVGGLLSFVALSGLAVWIWPFGNFVQVMVLLHTVVGVIATAAFVVWQMNHWLATRKVRRNFRKICAYTGFWLLAANIVAGFVVSGQALFGRYIGTAWHLIHLWTALPVLVLLGYHVYPSRRASNQPLAVLTPGNHGSAHRLIWQRAAAIVALLLLFGVTMSGFYTASHKGHPPEDRVDVGGRPFSPSLVNTDTGQAIAVAQLANSASCGTSDCHSAVYTEWLGSAHRWSAEDSFFQEVRKATIQVKGEHETEKCGACHDPVSLLSGHKDPTLGGSSPGYKEGDSCLVCHAVSHVDERGIGSYVLREPKPYLYDRSSGRFRGVVNHFLIRSYPGQHNRDYDLGLLHKPESCAPCHKEFDVIKEQEGLVQVETQYDDWKAGKWNTDPDPARRLYCQQCHMYSVETPHSQADPYDLKSGAGGRHRNHAFAAGNQYMPHELSMPDATIHTQHVTEWLKGERGIPEIAKVWPQGPIVQLKISTPESANPVETIRLQVSLLNQKLGHGFPTGPLNISRAWLEVLVRDAAGNLIFHSGMLDGQGHIEQGSYILKPLAINSSGHMVMEADLWHPAGPKFRPALAPGQQQTFDYQFAAPRTAPGPLSVIARLRYRRASQFFMDAVYSGTHRETPITDICSGSAAIALPERVSALRGKECHRPGGEAVRVFPLTVTLGHHNPRVS